jgi:hypothetical protein
MIGGAGRSALTQGAAMFVGALCAAGLLIDFLDRRYLSRNIADT